MIIVMKQSAQPRDVEAVVSRIEELGYKVHLSRGEARTIVGVIGADEYLLQRATFEVMDGVEKTMRVMQPYKLASRDFSHENTVIQASGATIGGKRIAVMAGPCSVESREMIIEIAHAVKEAGRDHICAAAPTSHAAVPTVSRAWAKKGCATWPRHANRPACRSSPRS